MIKVIRRVLVVGFGALLFAMSAYVVAGVVGGRSLAEMATFLGRFIEDPSSVGAIAPSLRPLALALVAKVVPGTLGRGKRFLEVGPGSGAVTEELVAVLGPDDHLDLVELDAHLAQGLCEKYAQNSQVSVQNCSITDWRPAEKYDAVVMGIPFNALPFSLVEAIWAHVFLLVKPEGAISYFSYLWLPSIKKAFLSKSQKRDFKKIQKHLAWQYKTYGIGTQRVLPNVPPAMAFYLQPDRSPMNAMIDLDQDVFSDLEA